MVRDIHHTVLDDNVDYVKLAEALWEQKVIRVTKKEEVETALKEAIAYGKTGCY